MKLRHKTMKKYLDEVCDMLDTYGGRDKVSFFGICFEKNSDFEKKKKSKLLFFNLKGMREMAGHGM